jgi:hypothetical protein
VALRDQLERLATRLFLVGDAAGVHVLPKHYYSPIADRRWLRAHPESWQRRLPLAGVDWSLDDQVAWVRSVVEGFVDELGEGDPARFPGYGPGYGPIEGQFLYAFVRACRPRRIVEVGSGVSTAIMSGAGQRNAAEGSEAPSIVCIDPFASSRVESLPGVEVIRAMCQLVDRAAFDRLRAGDLLFIDSTHAVKTGSELVSLYLEVLPSLPPDVFVHIHDIVLPFAFAPDVLETLWDWQETTLVTALLTGNAGFEILAAQSALHHDRSGDLRAIFPAYQPRPMSNGIYDRRTDSGHFPASLWLRTRSTSRG